MKRFCLIDCNTNKVWFTLCKEIKRTLDIPNNKEILVSLHVMILVELSDIFILSAGNLARENIKSVNKSRVSDSILKLRKQKLKHAHYE